MDNAPVFDDITVNDWQDLQRLAPWFSAQVGPWMFRGQRDYRWPLSTTIERTLLGETGAAVGIAEIERRMLLDFRRRVHECEPAVPREPDLEGTYKVEWLATVQHHGGITRLLDFTHAFWVAAFFALEPRPVPDEWPSHAAIWCVNAGELWHNAIAKIETKGLGYISGEPGYTSSEPGVRSQAARVECGRRIPLGHENERVPVPEQRQPIALPVEPAFQNRRLAAQGGCFIFPLVDSRSFAENLFGTFGQAPPTMQEHDRTGTPFLFNLFGPNRFDSADAPPAIVRISIPVGTIGLRQTGRRLLNNMGLSADRLFPDQDGLARSLSRHIT